MALHNRFIIRGNGWYPILVKKTSIYLDPDLDADLARIARRLGITKAEFIRQALRRATEADERPRLTAIGVGEGPGDVSSDIERHLEETGFGAG
jgi:hypothetical protein